MTHHAVQSDQNATEIRNCLPTQLSYHRTRHTVSSPQQGGWRRTGGGRWFGLVGGGPRKRGTDAWVVVAAPMHASALLQHAVLRAGPSSLSTGARATGRLGVVHAASSACGGGRRASSSLGEPRGGSSRRIERHGGLPPCARGDRRGLRCYAARQQMTSDDDAVLEAEADRTSRLAQQVRDATRLENVSRRCPKPK